MALRIVKNLCIHAVKATFLAFPPRGAVVKGFDHADYNAIATRVLMSEHGPHVRAASPDYAPTP